jgi:hypothetical protein
MAKCHTCKVNKKSFFYENERQFVTTLHYSHIAPISLKYCGIHIIFMHFPMF